MYFDQTQLNSQSKHSNLLIVSLQILGLAQFLLVAQFLYFFLRFLRQVVRLKKAFLRILAFFLRKMKQN